LNSFEKLKTFLERKKEKSKWDYGEGFMRGKPNSNTAEYLTGKKALLAPKFKSSKVQLQILNDIWFTSPRRKSLFSGPLLLIKEIIEAKSSIIPTYFSINGLGFDSRILGISSNGNDVKSLIELADSFKNHNQLYSYYITLTSSQFLVGLSSAFRADDIYNLPCFLESNEIDMELLTTEEKIIVNDTLKYLLDFKRKGENSEIATENATEKNLSDYGEVFCTVLNSVFKSIKPYQYFETDSYICFPFYFGDKPNIDFTHSKQAEKNIERLVKKNLGISLRLTRIVRLYEGNVIYLIKPKKLRYWLKSIALRDADETFSDLKKQGY
jgi:hypothetical protein